MRKKKKKVDTQPYIDEINLARCNPSEYAKKIEHHLQFVTEVDGKFVYENGEISEKLLKGPEQFQKAIEYFRELAPLAPLKYLSDLNFEIDVEAKRWKDADVLKEAYENKTNAIKGRASLTNAFYEYGSHVLDAETCLILYMVDDSKTKGAKRLNLLNSDVDVIGLQLKKTKTKGIVYFTVGVSD